MAARYIDSPEVGTPNRFESLIVQCENGSYEAVFDIDAQAIVAAQAGPLVRRRLVPLLRQKGALAELAHILQAYLHTVPGTATDRTLLASILGQLGRTDEARALLDDLGANAPTDPAVATARLQRELADGRLQEAAAIAARYAEWDQITLRAAHLGMLALVRAGCARAALDLLAAFKEPISAALAAVAIDAHLALGERDEANRMARRAIKQGQESAVLYYQLGSGAAAEYHYDRAVAHFTKGLACAPNDVRILAALGEILLMQGRPAAAMVHLGQALQLAPDLVHVRVLQARGFKALRRYDDAAREWARVVESQPANPQWRREAASVLNLADRKGEARALFGDLLRDRATALPSSFEAGLDQLWDKVDEVTLPQARLDWAWNMRDPSNVLSREEWTRRANWGYLADRLIFDWLECSPERAEQAMHRLADLDDPAADLMADAGRAGGLIIATAHIGPMFAGPLALQLLDFESVWLASSPSMPGMAYTSSLISTSDQTDAQVVRRAIQALESGRAVGLAVDGAMSLAAPRIQFEGQEVTYSSFAARLAYRWKAASYFTAPQWTDGRLTFHLARLPSPEKGEAIESFSDRWRDAYLAQLRCLLGGSPENLRLSGGIWRHVKAMV